MRIVAIILGVISGLAGLGIAAMGDLALGFLSLGGSSSGMSAAKLILWGLPVATLVGAALVYSSPAFGAMLLLGSAAGWFAVGQFFGAGVNSINGTTLILAGLAGLFAIGALAGSESGTFPPLAPSPLVQEPPADLAHPHGTRATNFRSDPPLQAAPRPAADSGELDLNMAEERVPRPRMNPFVPAAYAVLAFVLLVASLTVIDFFRGPDSVLFGVRNSNGSVPTLAATSPAPTESIVAPMPDVGYPWDIQKDFAQYTAYQRLFSADEATLTWLYTLQGVGDRMTVVSIGGVQYLAGWFCKQHACNTDQAAFLVAKDGSRAVVSVYSVSANGGTPYVMGRPTPAEATYLTQLVAQHRQ